MTPAGIDKIVFRVSASDYRIRDFAQIPGFQAKRPMLDMTTNQPAPGFTLRDGKGQEREIARGFVNLGPDQGFKPMHLDFGPMGMQVNWNPSKAYHPWELCRDTEVLTRRFEALTEALMGLGIDADFRSADLLRLDLTEQSPMKQPLKAYSRLWQLFRMKRVTKTDAKQYPDGFQHGSENFGFLLYNKGRELDDKELMKANILRIEEQFKTPQGIAQKTNLGPRFKNVSGLLDTGLEVAGDEYRRILSTKLLDVKNMTGDSLVIDFESDMQMLQDLARLYPRNFFDAFLAMHGLPALLEKYGTLDALQTMITEAQVVSSRRLRDQMTKVRRLALQRDRLSSLSVGELYREVVAKFALAG